MIRKFFEGIVFGSGIAVAFILTWFAISYFILPFLIDEELANIRKYVGVDSVSTPEGVNEKEKSIAPTDFITLTLNEQIQVSSIIMMVKYEDDESTGKKKAIIAEFLKNENNVVLHYKVGEEYPPSSFYPKIDRIYGNGSIVFFMNSPAIQVLTITFFGDRLQYYGDLPITEFREMCAG